MPVSPPQYDIIASEEAFIPRSHQFVLGMQSFFVPRTMFYCGDMGQMAQPLAVQSETGSLLWLNKQNLLSPARETLVAAAGRR